MARAIADARREILLEMYWFGSDQTGRHFADLLSRRAREGVRVCITYDAFGSWDTSLLMFRQLRSAGCQVHRWNPLGNLCSHFHPRLLQRRNHRKMLIVDRQVGFVGGLNLGDPWAPESMGGQNFRDDMVQIEGPAVERLRFLFLKAFRAGPRTEPALAGTEAAKPTAPSARYRGSDGATLSILSNYNLRSRHIIERAYLAAIQSARRSILISNSYFIPRGRMRKALADAAGRGVEVCVLTPDKSDVPLAAYASRHLFGWLLARGVQLYEWPGTVLHSKIATIDDAWCTLGTHNLDYRSYLYNVEVNVVFQSMAVASTLAARLRADLAQAYPVDPQRWRYRPLTNRFLEHICYFFRCVL